MITLTEEQEECVKFLNEKFKSKSPNDRISTLAGVAGAGKSTSIVELVRMILKRAPRAKIGILAPTHKAVSVNRKMVMDAGFGDTNISCSTLHSALGLKHVIKDGTESFEQDRYGVKKYFRYTIIDECSMIDDDLLEYIVDSDWNKILFVGDECQISPVNYEVGEVSRTFETENLSRLDKVVRQAENSPIISLATNIRLSQQNVVGWPAIEQETDMFGGGVFVLTDSEWERKLFEMIDLDDPDTTRAVAYRNATCRDLNLKVRRHLFGDDVYQWKVGETIVANGSREQTYTNNQEVLVTEIEDFVDSTHEVPCDLVTVQSHDGETFMIKLIKEEYKQTYQYRLDTIRDRAYLDKSAWKEFWALKKAFDDFRHIYVGTVHKSQGSTFKNTFVYTPDILAMGPTLEAKQLLYTATTRSSESTFFATGR